MPADVDNLSPDRATAGTGPDKVIPIRHYGRWVTVAILLVLAAMAIHAIVTRKGFQWNVVAKYMFSEAVVMGVVRTLVLTLIAMTVGYILGTVVAVMRLSENPLLRWFSITYVWIFRGTPVLVQLLFWYYLAAVFPTLSIGIPFGPEWVTADSSKLITQFTAAILGLGLAAAGYMAEIIRAGILSVNSGQIEAAESLGMSRGMVLRRILLPQAMRMIIPPTGNEMISTLKGSSIVIVIAYSELMTSVQTIYSQTFETIPLLIVASIWYLVLTTVLGLGQRYIEKYFSRGYTRRTMKAPKAMTTTGDVR